jgi:hypothetical protein
MPRKSSAALAFSPGTATRLRPPDDLTGDARKVFVDLVVACRADHFQPSDAPLLAAYCRAVVAEKIAAGELAAANVVDDKPSPWLPVWLGKLRAVTTLSRMLRLNPAGRQSVPSSEPEPISAYERIALEHRDERN